MSKLGVLNGKYIDPLTKKIETRNLFLSNGILVGMGVMWDEKEDEFDCVDVSHGLIIPQVSSIVDARQSDPITIDRFKMLANSEGVQNIYVMDSRFSDSEYLTNFMEPFLVEELSLYPIAPLILDHHDNTDSLESSALSTLKEQGVVGCFCSHIPEDTELFIQALYIAELLSLPVLFDASCDLERLTAALLQFPKLKMGIVSDQTVTLVHSIDQITDTKGYVMKLPLDNSLGGEALKTYLSLDPERPLLDIVWSLSYEFRQFFNQSSQLMKIGQPVQLTVIDLSDDTFGQIKLSCFQNQVNLPSSS